MSKTIVSVSKKKNSVYRIYFYELNDDNEYKFQSKRINRLLVWFWKLQKQKLCNDICIICDRPFKFYKRKWENRIDVCFECEPSKYQEY